MRKRIGYQFGVLHEGWLGQVRKWYGWRTVIAFDDERAARMWLKTKKNI